MASTATTRQIATVPNAITVGRLLFVPVFLWLLWGREERVAAAVLLGVLGATDWLDGWIARRWDQATELGKILDPVADRAVLIAGAIALLVEDMPAAVDVVLWIVLVREVVIATITVSLAVAGARRIDVLWAGKAGTLSLMFALPLFLLAEAVSSAELLFAVAGWGFAVASIGLGYYAAVRYLPEARRALRDGRTARHGGISA